MRKAVLLSGVQPVCEGAMIRTVSVVWCPEPFDANLIEPDSKEMRGSDQKIGECRIVSGWCLLVTAMEI